MHSLRRCTCRQADRFLYAQVAPVLSVICRSTQLTVVTCWVGMFGQHTDTAVLTHTVLFLQV
jgi:hypothetical protein